MICYTNISNAIIGPYTKCQSEIYRFVIVCHLILKTYVLQCHLIETVEIRVDQSICQNKLKSRHFSTQNEVDVVRNPECLLITITNASREAVSK